MSHSHVFLCCQVSDVDELINSSPDQWQILKRSTEVQIDPGYLSEPSSIEFPTEGGLTAFMNYYPPKNKDFKLPPGHKPALLVKIHGGPTSSASTALSLGYQWWTSRGESLLLSMVLLQEVMHVVRVTSSGNC